MNSQSSTSAVLSSQGLKTSVDSRLLWKDSDWGTEPEFRAHAHTLRRLFADLEIDAVLCVDGRPSVCLKDAQRLPTAQIEELRRKLWNLGETTLLVIETQRDVQVFSTVAKPARQDQTGLGAKLGSETIHNLEATALALQLQRLIRRVETGAVYRDHKSLFDPQGSVNRQLLNNLREVRNLIATKKTENAYRRAHAFIGRFLFSCYLLDRGIIGPPYLKKAGLPEAIDMLSLLDNSDQGPDTLRTLFKVLQRDFNGSLLGDLGLEDAVKSSEVIYLRRFLSGEDLSSGQLSLFKLYDFAFIPVELISSIYEEFLGAEAEAARPSRQSRLRANGQRTQGAYYTPPRLAELAVDIATEEWDTLLDKHCLDPACGSGVFLVILFIRMAEEWRKRNPGATTRRRYEALLSLMSENLYGVDTHPTACLVSCFSLYLAFLDQMQPKEVIELREALEQTQKKLLPRILWERDKSRPRPPHFDTVREFDFFALPAETEFDLVIGNPPWISRKPAAEVEEWLFCDESNPYLNSVAEKEKRQTMFPAGEVACGFMWKAALHLSANGRVCQVLPSRVLLSNNTDRFQAAWLQHHQLESLWLLVDWSFILFRTADCPCFIGRYRRRKNNQQLDSFDFITPKVDSLDPREALIPVLPEDRKSLSQSEIMSAAQANEAAAAWKKHHWGTPRDTRLIDRLMDMPRLKQLAKRPPRNPASISADRKRTWFKGQGFQPATDSTDNPEPIFWNKSDRFLASDVHVLDLILQPEDCPPIGSLYKDTGLHRKRSPLIYEAPLLLINKACTKFLFSGFDVLFKDDFLSIAAPKSEEDELLFLTAVLSCPLTQYLLFHTTANIGVERDIARTEEILELPFPLPENMPDPKRSETLLRACAKRLRKLRDELKKSKNSLKGDELVSEAQSELYEFVCDYFQISQWEQELIEDTVKIFRPSSTPGAMDSDGLLTVRPANFTQRKQYADTLIKTFRGWTHTNKYLWAEGNVAEQIGLALITMGLADVGSKYAESKAEDRISSVLDQLREASTQRETTSFHYLRGFVLYESDRVHVLKPLNRRHWTRTAALNDADEILTRMMEEGGWRD
jgi:uncharacterized protein YifE (UPF0438 family)